MKWKELLSPNRFGTYKKNTSNHEDVRNEFEKDYHRIIGSSSFRRLQDKTQVFPLDKSDFIRTRLTHSLEVSSFAKSLGQSIGARLIEEELDSSFTAHEKGILCDILQCAGLIHDIGNPPFGHFGEQAIREFFRKNLEALEVDQSKVSEILTLQMKEDFYHFEGNAQALRQVTKLHYLVNENGMNLTYGLLNTIIKYPVPSTSIEATCGEVKKKKMGYFHSEEDLFKKIVSTTKTYNNRHPLTFVLEAADDIAYRTADIEDAFKKGCFNCDTLLKELERYVQGYPLEELIKQYQKAKDKKVRNPQLYALQNWIVRIQSYLLINASKNFINHYPAIMNGSYTHSLLHNTKAGDLLNGLGKIAHDYAFTSMPILKLEIAASTILSFLLERLVPAALQYDSTNGIGMMEQKYVNLISDNYKQIYHYYAKDKSYEEKVYLRLLLVTDYISGMTDSFAKNLYQELNGIN